MKKLILIAIFATFCGELAARPKVTVGVEFTIGRPKFFCEKGIWICKPKLDIDVDLAARGVNANFTDNGDGTLTIDLLSPLPEEAAEFFAENDESVSLPSAICAKLGYGSVTLIPGHYRISRTSDSKYGSINVKIQTR